MKIGVKPPGPGMATSAKRAAELIATSTPSKATDLALSSEPWTSISSATKHSPTSAVSSSGAVAAPACCWLLVCTVAAKKGARKAATPSKVLST